MKKSEMVSILQDWLTYNCPDEYPTNFWRKEQASNLLSLIESKGMLPPDNVLYYVNEWEQE